MLNGCYCMRLFVVESNKCVYILPLWRMFREINLSEVACCCWVWNSFNAWVFLQCSTYITVRAEPQRLVRYARLCDKPYLNKIFKNTITKESSWIAKPTWRLPVCISYTIRNGWNANVDANALYNQILNWLIYVIANLLFHLVVKQKHFWLNTWCGEYISNLRKHIHSQINSLQAILFQNLFS